MRSEWSMSDGALRVCFLRSSAWRPCQGPAGRGRQAAVQRSTARPGGTWSSAHADWGSGRCRPCGDAIGRSIITKGIGRPTRQLDREPHVSRTVFIRASPDGAEPTNAEPRIGEPLRLDVQAEVARRRAVRAHRRLAKARCSPSRARRCGRRASQLYSALIGPQADDEAVWRNYRKAR
jgi:hypothetical protein